ncbi:MAG: glycosyltransferase family 39 protein [Victivallaceae bacterium]|nr:glycosyltransferase family 39 protein [Victivallaceae bacterium]
MKKNRIVYLIGLALLMLSLLSISFLPIMDPSEARYSQVSKDMVSSGDYITPQIWINGELVPFWGKPPLFFWLDATSIKYFGANAFAARLPSALCGFLLVLLSYFILKRYRDKETAFAAAVIMFSCGGFFFVAGVVLLDMCLIMFTAGAWLCYYAFLQERDRKLRNYFSLAVFVLLALGFLTKGPVALAMFGIPVFCWTLMNKRWQTLKHHAWVMGIILFLVITVPWFWVAEVKTPGFLYYFFINENLLRFIKHDYGDLYGTGHRFPYGTAIGFILLSTMPWSLILLGVVIAAFKRSGASFKSLMCSKARLLQLLKLPAEAGDKYDFFIVGLLSITLFWCFARQLLLYYLLPAVPAFAIYCAILLKHHRTTLKQIVTIAAITVIIYVIALGCLSFTLGRQKSTKGVLAQVASSASDKRHKRKIVFVRRVPYSAYFYGDAKIVPHPKETVNDSIRRGFDTKENIYITKEKYLKRIDPSLKEQLTVTKYSGTWYILAPLEI